MATAEKAPGALKTIGELSHELGVAQHILRYWETRFPQLKPMQRAGNRRYYRPADVDLARRINRLLNEEGYTVRGVQKVLRERDSSETATISQMPISANSASGPNHEAAQRDEPNGVDVFRLIQLRNRLVERVLHHMCHSLAVGTNVKVSGFGTFILRDKGQRVGRNPKTGIEVPIAPRRVMTFRASQIMRDRIAG